MKLLLPATLALGLLISAAQAAPMPGGDRDMHGCIGSAGYTWSKLRQNCVRLFEGIRLNPAMPTGDTATLSAFLIFPAGHDGPAVEVFLPGRKGSLILRRAGPGLWQGAGLKVTRAGAQFTLGKPDGTALFQGPQP